jgi:myxalamid-type polyketide synthase MxaD
MSDSLIKLIADLSAEKRAILAEYLQLTPEPVAIIGMGCRFPGGANNPQTFWQLLQAGADLVTEVPPGRWDVEAFYDPDPAEPGKMYTRWGAFVDQVDGFDAGFFGISPREAVRMDPQQRLLLEVAWEALEAAGQGADSLAGSQTGVFIGVCASDYSYVQFTDLACLDAYTATGNAHSIVANRLSYLFDLQGPSFAVDTACSSSLVAVHLACQSLRSKECNLALAGGVHLILSPLGGITFSKAQMMSADGRCKTFDARADGFVRGEGCGVVILKRLADALADGDTILALIRGSAVNQDGRTNGLMAPNGLSQQAVIRQALQQAGAAPADVTYIEAHGTGTALGDPIEVEALAEVYGRPGRRGMPCAIGSVKTNLGHLEASAGIVGLIKTVLALQHAAIPPHLHFQKLNPYISLERTRFFIPTQLQPWPAGNQKRLAGVSSFGFGGTNAHVLLEEAPDPAPVPEAVEGQAYLLPISARSPRALRDLAAAYQSLLNETKAAVADICYSASLRRTHHEERLSVVGRSAADLAARLGEFLGGQEHADLAIGRVVPANRQGIVFVFSGQGTQYVRMGQEMLRDEPVFGAVIEQCDEIFNQLGGWSLLTELAAGEERSRLDQTEIAQPAIFSIQVALAALWRSWGIVPRAVIGHSVGEIAAAYEAGALSLEEAARIAFQRGQLMQPATGQGKMAAVELTPSQAERLLEPYNGRISIAAINGPRSVVLSGEGEALDEVIRQLQERGVFCRLLAVNYAFHSAQMDPVRAGLEAALQGLHPQPAHIRVFSTVTGQAADGKDFSPAYWAENTRRPVQFAAAIEAALSDGMEIFLEVGPHPALGRAIQQCAQAASREVSILGSLRRSKEERPALFNSLGKLYTLGAPIQWKKLVRTQRRLVPLPTYPWQRERFWSDGPTRDDVRSILPVAGTAFGRPDDPDRHPLLGVRCSTPLREILFESRLSRSAPAYLQDHQLFGLLVVPAVSFLEMALAAAAQVLGPASFELSDLAIREALILPAGEERSVQTILEPEDPGEASFKIFSTKTTSQGDGGIWREHASGKVRAIPAGGPTRIADGEALKAVQARCRADLPTEGFYQLLHQRGFEYGSSFQGVTGLWIGELESLGRIHLPAGLAPIPASYQFHPALLEACMQALGPMGVEIFASSEDIFIPVSFNRFRFYRQPGEELWSHGRVRPSTIPGRDYFVGDVRIFNSEGQVVAEVEGLLFRRATAAMLAQTLQEPAADWLFELSWQPKELPTSVNELELPSGGWLIFAGKDSLGDELAQLLERDGCRVVQVTVGDSYASLTPGHYQIDPTDPEQYRRLLSEAFPGGEQPCRTVVHLWGLDADEWESLPAGSMTDEQELGCRSLLYLAKALARSGGTKSPQMWAVTCQSQSALPVEATAASTAAVMWGLGRVIAIEQPETWGGIVDLEAGQREGAASFLLEEMRSKSGENQVAFRQGKRYVARLAHTARPPASGTPGLRKDAAYLIAGGLGGVGLQLARWLVEQGARHLALLGRSAPSAAADLALQELETAGAQVAVLQADIADPQQLAQALQYIRTNLPPLRGVFHAAGVLDDGVLLQQDWERFRRVLRPKVQGAWNLHLQTEGLPLDFFVLFSTAASLLGSPGQGNYAAASAFLDSLAHYRRARGLPALCLNWGPWAGAGMAASVDSHFKRRWLSEGIAELPPERALNVMGQLMQGFDPQFAVLSVDWTRIAQVFPPGREPPLLSGLLLSARLEGKLKGPGRQRVEILKKLQEAPPNRRRDALAAYLRDQLVQVLGLTNSDDLPLARGFFEMGMDSLMALDLKNRLEMDLGFSIPATLIFEYPTIETLSEYLVAEGLADLVASGAEPDQNTKLSAPAGADTPEEPLLGEAVMEQADTELLAQIDQLSDEEVDALLSQMLATEEPGE